MYTIIAGTDRLNSNSQRIGWIYQEMLLNMGVESELTTLEGVDLSDKSERFLAFQNDFLVPSKKFILVLPEYNGSYPGVFKSLIDLSDIKACWPGKKALLVGVATGRGGNIRGLDHITGVLHYLNVLVHPNKLPISSVDKLISADGKISDARTISSIENQVAEFINF
ncbi:MAG: NADPH-dependent FMN reductase [bacterium]|jgi:chromate reductase